MIELSTLVPKMPSPVSVPAVPGGAAGGFVQLLSAFLDATAGAGAEGGGDPALPADRHDIAGDGKALPDDDADTQEKDDADPALIWLPVDVPMPPPDPRLPVVLTGMGGQAPAAGAALPGGLPVPGEAGTGAAALIPAASPSGAAALPAADAEASTLPVPTPVSAATPASAEIEGARPKTPARGAGEALRAGSTPGLAAAAPAPADLPATQPAGQAFAAAIAAAAQRARPAPVEEHSAPVDPAAGLAAAHADGVDRPVVMAVADAKQAPLDLRDDRGLQGMIDRIEALRDDANAHDTRIRLVPDALGGVDVAVRKQGDTVHVHFAADTQATRTLLAEAQPRLVELAEARGVKLGQTSVGADGGGANPQPRPEAPRAPAPAPAPVTVAAHDISTDQRLA